MKTKATDAVILVIAVRNGIDVVARRHRLVKRRVKRRNLQPAWDELMAALDNSHGSGVVQRGKMRDALDLLHDVVIYLRAAVKEGAAMGNAMPYGLDLLHAGKRLAGAGYMVDDDLQGSLDIRSLHLAIAPVGLETSMVGSYGLDHALGQDGHVICVCAIKELELERARARIEDEDDH